MDWPEETVLVCVYGLKLIREGKLSPGVNATPDQLGKVICGVKVVRT